LKIAATGESGASRQVEAIEGLGGSVSGQWLLMGRYDLALVATFPDAATAAAYTLMANAGGLVTESFLALNPSELALAQDLVLNALAEPDFDATEPAPETHSGAERG
jgi:uncharacterized protein with GYD domain